MAGLHDLTGRRFGRLTILRVVGAGQIGGNRVHIWLCRCDCGTLLTKPASHLMIYAQVRSCGCHGKTE